jgi:hypothetical protein
VKFHAPAIFILLSNYFSIKNSVNWVYGTVDWVHGHGSPQSTSFIKPWSSTLGSMAWIKSIKGVSACLIMAVGSWSDGGETPARYSGSVLGPRRWQNGTPANSWFSAYGAPNQVHFLPTAPHWQEELSPLTFRWQWLTWTLGRGGITPPSIGDSERWLWHSSSFKK